MKKGFKIILASLGSIALLAGIAGAVYGSNSNIKNWIDNKINEDNSVNYPDYHDNDFGNNSSSSSDSGSTSQDSQTGSQTSGGSNSGSQSSGDNSGSSNSGGNQGGNSGGTSGGNNQGGSSQGNTTSYDDVNCTITLSKSKIYLEKANLSEDTSIPFSANIVGNPSDSRLLWWPLSNQYLSISKTVTQPNETLTVTSAYFNTTQYIRVCMLANTSIYADLPVVYVNDFTKMDFEGIGIFAAGTGTSKALCDSTTLSSSAKAKTWTDNAGTYFHCEPLYRSQMGWYSTPEVALEEGHICEVTASPGAEVYIKSRTHTHSSSNFIVMREADEFNGTIQSTWTVAQFTDIQFAMTELRYSDFGSDWDIFFKMKLPADFEGKTGTVVLKLMNQWYYAIHFNAYYGVSSGSLNETSVDFGG